MRQEQVTGGVLMALLGLELANVYQNLTNVILTITPKDCQDVPAVLVNAHFDSAVGSPGLVQGNCLAALYARIHLLHSVERACEGPCCAHHLHVIKSTIVVADFRLFRNTA